MFEDSKICSGCGVDCAPDLRPGDSELLKMNLLKAKPLRCGECVKQLGRRAHHKRRAAIQGNGGSYSESEIAKMLIDQSGQCVYCQCDITGGFHIDHILPVSRGGSSNIENLQLLCPFCNLSKGAKTHEEFLIKRNS